jgi:hypothetical protein
MANDPTYLEWPDNGRCIAPTAEGLLKVHLPEDGQLGLIRLDVGRGRRLDIPLSDHCLAEISRALAPKVKPQVPSHSNES